LEFLNDFVATGVIIMEGHRSLYLYQGRLSPGHTMQRQNTTQCSKNTAVEYRSNVKWCRLIWATQKTSLILLL